MLLNILIDLGISSPTVALVRGRPDAGDPHVHSPLLRHEFGISENFRIMCAADSADQLNEFFKFDWKSVAGT